MSYVFDIIILVILLYGIISGARRGFLAAVLRFVCMLLAVTAASVISTDAVCGDIYDEYLHEKVAQVISTSMDNAKQQAVDRLRTAVSDTVGSTAGSIVGESAGENISHGIKDFASKYEEQIGDFVLGVGDFLGITVRDVLTDERVSAKLDTTADMYSQEVAQGINGRLPFGIEVSPEKIHEIISDKKLIEVLLTEILDQEQTKTRTGYEDTAEYIEQSLVRPAAIRALRTVVWAAAFVIVSAVLNLIVRIVLLIVRRLKAVNLTDRVLGALLGTLGSSVAVFAIVFVCVMVFRFLGDFDYLNEDIISGTIVFKHIFYLINGMIQ
ncbi:MAG: CvpA family protein [Oscillospiraceae bacterium]|nr:CvpA family protein [Oscillospiraceae bacterium]